jgi:preprotein translocase subunit YajC
MELFILQSSGNNFLVSMMPLLLMFIVIYFFFIRPQVKKQKDQNNFLNEIKKGDEVVTSSGIIGRINKIDESVVNLQIDSKTFIRITKGSISRELTDQLNKT